MCVYVKGHCGDQLKFYSNFLRKTNKLLLLSSICSCHYTKNLQPGQFINYICSTKTSCLLVISYVATRLSLVLYIEEEIFFLLFLVKILGFFCYFILLLLIPIYVFICCFFFCFSSNKRSLAFWKDCFLFELFYCCCFCCCSNILRKMFVSFFKTH